MAGKQIAAKSTGSVHVYSTLSTPQKFTVWEPPRMDGMLPTLICEVLIKGGAGIASKNLITPQGVHTAITQEEFDAISTLASFQKFVDDGYIRVEGKKYDIDRMVGDMNPRDPGGPLTPADFEREAKDGSTPVPVELEKAGSGWVANQLANR